MTLRRIAIGNFWTEHVFPDITVIMMLAAPMVHGAL